METDGELDDQVAPKEGERFVQTEIKDLYSEVAKARDFTTGRNTKRLDIYQTIKYINYLGSITENLDILTSNDFILILNLVDGLCSDLKYSLETAYITVPPKIHYTMYNELYAYTKTITMHLKNNEIFREDWYLKIRIKVAESEILLKKFFWKVDIEGGGDTEETTRLLILALYKSQKATILNKEYYIDTNFEHAQKIDNSLSLKISFIRSLMTQGLSKANRIGKLSQTLLVIKNYIELPVYEPIHHLLEGFINNYEE